MSRYEQRVHELVALDYRLDLAEKIAEAEERERITNMLARIAVALEQQSREAIGKAINQIITPALHPQQSVPDLPKRYKPDVTLSK